MTSVQHHKGRARRWIAAALGLSALAAPAASMAANAGDQLYERTLMTAADGRCRLFAPAISAALDAARAQARGATLRSGASEQQVQALEQRARAKADGAACNSPDLTTAATRVKKAFEGYAQMQTMTYPGDVASWKAERAVSATIPVWRLSQLSAFGADRLMFGLAGRAKAVTAVATFENGQRPYAARIIVRDTNRTQGPYIDPRGGRALSAKVAPRNASLVFTAETREEAPATLLPVGAKTGLAFRFPTAVADAMSELDPREAVTVEFAFPGRGDEMTRRAYVEVGDFAAGRAFLR
ncbi:MULTISPECIES: hypothetical protein [Caulobacter]|jgi:hypothetical protein|uniref:DUF4384 domain-containing protein n=1 Tax=Caulobacter vibrioides OR37 TaxID=1292034 RepID=R0CVR9_CAUVI|nr:MULTISPECIES: hypothetical protein [Caulobacter]ENZ80606.1 hypothetical protein OR37_03518 [Caulobacter vibrioides OR37]MBQ1561559.1 hypothetical protein [Caulobacter sp.]